MIEDERLAVLTTLIVASLSTSAIVAIRYLATSGLFDWITRKVRPGMYEALGPQIRKEIRWSLLSALIYGVPTGIVAWGWDHHGWTRVYFEWSDYPLWYAPLSLMIYLIAHDAWFYWTHRAMHRPYWFKRAHAVHHKSRPPTAWTAMSFHPLEALTGAVVIPFLVLLVPIHLYLLIAFLSIMTLMGITNHMGWELLPQRLVHSSFGNWVVTASHHGRHHEDYQCNFGLYFRFWDKLCGTDKGFSRNITGASVKQPRSLA